ncbi:MAG: hypothetical protein M0C28_31325 [Candidatus Moduliflexus flocculans]|nr:hypothetical protein [Candidatus Moduliflexus flocculans]
MGDEEHEVADIGLVRESIPNLYEAGELGSFVPNLYQNGAYLMEAIFSGPAAAVDMFKK